jgi:hypothetical protein
MQGERLASGPLAQRDIERLAHLLLRGLARQTPDVAQPPAGDVTLPTAPAPVVAAERRRDGDDERAA